MILSIPEISLLSILVLCLFVQLYYVLFVHLKLAQVRVEEIPETAKEPVSVIICARNEITNLERYLPSILNQNYPDFQVVVVNDRSWDGTEEF